MRQSFGKAVPKGAPPNKGAEGTNTCDHDLIRELETAVSQGTTERRLAALWHVTDLLNTGRYTDKDIWTFGEVVSVLASEIEVSARAQLADRLAPCSNAPISVINKLAFDDSINVAGPILRRSERLTDQILVENAKCKSQDHLLAISHRKSLREEVTDVLVSRGNQAVLHSVAKNNGARFSDGAFWHLVRRCEDDIVLTMEVGARKDIPRHHFQMLITRASDEAKAKLVAINPSAAAEIQHVVADVTGALQAKFGPASKSYFVAKKHVTRLYDSGQLTEEAIHEFAKFRKFEEVTIALSLKCGLPAHVVERALQDDRNEMVVILSRAVNLSWATTKLVLLMCSGDAGVSAHDMDSAMNKYLQLNIQTARQVVIFHRSRAKAEHP